MGVLITNIGSSTAVSGGAITFTIGAGGVPAGVQIFVCFAENSASGSATIADSGSNSYSKGGTSNTGIGAYIARERTGNALVNGNTIVLTLSSGVTLAAASAFYVAGLDNVAGIDSQVNNTGTSSTPSVISSVPQQANVLFIGVVGGASAAVPAQDNTNAAWASPPGVVSSAGPAFVGGNFLRASKVALTYAPTFSVSDVWTATIIGYPLANFDMTSQICFI